MKLDPASAKDLSAQIAAAIGDEIVSGKLIVDAVFNRDYAVVQGVVLCTAVGFILMNLVADVLYVILNPRLRTAQ